jgi:hypothetical protein
MAIVRVLWGAFLPNILFVGFFLQLDCKRNEAENTQFLPSPPYLLRRGRVR